MGIRELKQQASEILRRVREKKEIITITYRGKAVAKLVPVESLEDKRAEAAAVWAE
ncbi:MAG TPA: type II toxin-antitoxin system prevent-host-death family antitoxin, partial [Dehalococcoidia bacterium]|nr:type II toxin-antitoxin system prevent-host-death family antitoxin [Dehalococcoidia bacterium]